MVQILKKRIQGSKDGGDFDNFLVKNPHFFLIYVLKDPPYSCDHFHTKIVVVGKLCVGGNREKLMKKHNKLQFGFDVIDDVTFMSHISSESPSSEVMIQ